MSDRPATEGVAEVLAVLASARVRRVDVPEPDLIAITLALGRTTTTLLLSASDAAPGLGLVDERPRGAPAGSLAQLLRKHLSGASIARTTTDRPGELRMTFRRGDERASLRVCTRRRGAGIVLEDGSGRALGGAPRGAESVTQGRAGPAEPGDWPRDLDELRVAGAALLARRSRDEHRGRDAALRKALVRERARVVRRIAAIEGDLARSQGAAALRAEGTLLLSSLASVPAHASEVTLIDPETGAPRRIHLDPARSVIDDAELRFVRARKLDRGAAIAQRRLDEGRAEARRFDEALLALDRGDVAPAEALARAPRSAPRRGVAEEPAPPKRDPFRTFVLEEGTIVLVGRSARDNDALTFRRAAPEDEVFHVRGRTGAHVVLRHAAGRAAGDDARRAAAALAAHFSAARGDTAVDVSAAVRRDLRRGKAPGSMIMRASTTLRVRMDQVAIEALLARERKQ